MSTMPLTTALVVDWPTALAPVFVSKPPQAADRGYHNTVDE